MKLVFDIDDTILFSKIRDDGSYELIGWNNSMIAKINRLHKEGAEIILHTGRHWNHLQLTISQLNRACVKYHTLVMGKPVADRYIDDKAMRPEEFLEWEV